MALCITFTVARIHVKGLPFHCRHVGNRWNFAYFSLWHRKYGR